MSEQEISTSYRGNSRNWPKGGRNSPQRFISTRFADHFSQLLLTKSSEASSRSFICGILDKTSLHSSHHVVWTYKITNFLSKNCFCAGQRVVSQPLRPLARMAPGLSNGHWRDWEMTYIMRFTLHAILILWYFTHVQVRITDTNSQINDH